MICKTCQKPTESTFNGRCFECNEVVRVAWQKKMAIRQDPAQFDAAKLVGLLLRDHWMHECEIVPAYMPPYRGSNTKPKCVVRYVYEDGSDTFLRYSAGPLQGYFWDCYGDDMHSPEMALVAIANAPPPVLVGKVIPTHGK